MDGCLEMDLNAQNFNRVVQTENVGQSELKTSKHCCTNHGLTADKVPRL